MITNMRARARACVCVCVSVCVNWRPVLFGIWVVLFALVYLPSSSLMLVTTEFPKWTWNRYVGQR